MKTLSFPRRFHPLLTLGAVALGSLPLFAADPSTKEHHGTIKAVDPAAHTLVVTDAKDRSEHRYQWTDKTKFVEGGKSTAASGLKAGESVHLTTQGAGDPPKLQTVRIGQAKKAKHGKSGATVHPSTPATAPKQPS